MPPPAPVIRTTLLSKDAGAHRRLRESDTLSLTADFSPASTSTLRRTRPMIGNRLAMAKACSCAVDTGDAVFDEHDLIAVFEGLPRRGLHAHVGRDTPDHQGLDATAPQLQVELGAVEGAPLPLGDDDIPRRLLQFRRESGPFRGQLRGAGQRTIDRLLQGVGKVGSPRHVGQDDGSPGCAKMPGEARADLEDRRPGSSVRAGSRECLSGGRRGARRWCADRIVA